MVAAEAARQHDRPREDADGTKFKDFWDRPEFPFRIWTCWLHAHAASRNERPGNAQHPARPCSAAFSASVCRSLCAHAYTQRRGARATQRRGMRHGNQAGRTMEESHAVVSAVV